MYRLSKVDMIHLSWVNARFVWPHTERRSGRARRRCTVTFQKTFVEGKLFVYRSRTFPMGLLWCIQPATRPTWASLSTPSLFTIFVFFFCVIHHCQACDQVSWLRIGGLYHLLLPIVDWALNRHISHIAFHFLRPPFCPPPPPSPLNFRRSFNLFCALLLLAFIVPFHTVNILF